MSKIDNINSNVMICIPTYKRKFFAALGLITTNPDLIFHLCVRKEEYENGFYDNEIFKQPNIRFVLLENVNCIGETREAILQESIKRGYKYCMMIDDTTYCIHDTTNRMYTLSSIINSCLFRFETDEFKDKAFSFIFSRKAFSNSANKQKTYFISQLCQVYIINLALVQEYDLHFKRMDLVGVEDLIFYFEACTKGLVALSDTRFIRTGLMPSVKKEGGCHHGNEERKEKDVQHERFVIMERYVDTLSNDLDKKFLKRVDSVLYPETYYWKLDTKYALKKLKGHEFYED